LAATQNLFWGAHWAENVLFPLGKWDDKERRTVSLTRLEESNKEVKQSMLKIELPHCEDFNKEVKCSAWSNVGGRIQVKLKEVFECVSLAANAVTCLDVTPEDIVRVCASTHVVNINPFASLCMSRGTPSLQPVQWLQSRYFLNDTVACQCAL
jgi:hypothetical protein